MTDDARHMAHALTLGRRGLGRCWPNPAVGCIVVRNGRVIGRGHTAPGGRPHGETIALAQAGAMARGATAYVTLEPCAHHGATPPCAQALIDAGIGRLVCAMGDPDPRVDGGGLAMLRAAGIEVVTGVGAGQAAIDHAGFVSRVTRGRPVVTLKLATSFDGRIATASGESRWITGPDARRAVHAMRMNHDAVLIGAGTARTDDPMLDVRGFGDVRQPVRVVVSGALDLPHNGRLARSAREVPLWLVHGPGADVARWSGLGARMICVAQPHDPAQVLSALGAAGLTRIFCEGGGELAASMICAGVVDRLVGFNAGLVLGAGGRPALAELGIDTLANAPRFRLDSVRQIGGDVMHIWSAPQRSTAGEHPL